MHSKEQFGSLALHVISRAAKAAHTVATIFALTLGLAPSAQAQSPAVGRGWAEQVLHSFCWNGTDGINPAAGVIFDTAGNLYGTTGKGGARNDGTVFELKVGDWTEAVLHSFDSTDGALPDASLIRDAAGNLYSTTSAGGPYNAGTVFELARSPNIAGGGWTEKVLYSFGAGTDYGGGPLAGLIFDATGNLYSTTAGGGAYNGNGGTVFELARSPNITGGGWTEKVLYSFGAGNDGSGPWAGLVFDAAGNLYGTTSAGGTGSNCSWGCGTVFELSPTDGGGWTEQVLHNFGNGTDGISPLAGLTFDAAGNLYGTTEYGGVYSGGTVFELSPTAGGGWTEQVLHSFNHDGVDGFLPGAGLIFDAAGNLYGTTLNGGLNSFGTAFELSPAVGGGWTEQVLHNFAGYPDGVYPSGLIFDASSNLYGTTQGGGTCDAGTVFKLSHN